MYSIDGLPLGKKKKKKRKSCLVRFYFLKKKKKWDQVIGSSHGTLKASSRDPFNSKRPGQKDKLIAFYQTHTAILFMYQSHSVFLAGCSGKTLEYFPGGYVLPVLSIFQHWCDSVQFGAESVKITPNMVDYHFDSIYFCFYSASALIQKVPEHMIKQSQQLPV